MVFWGVLSMFRGVFVDGRGVWGVLSMFWPVFVDGGGVLGCVVHVWAVSWLAGHGVLCGG